MVRFAPTGFEGFDLALTAAHLFLCAAAILQAPKAGLTVRLPVWLGTAPQASLKRTSSPLHYLRETGIAGLRAAQDCQGLTSPNALRSL